MVSRSLTEVYVLMRNNAIHTKQMFSEQYGENERIQLMTEDAESGFGANVENMPQDPPLWADSLEETQYIFTRLRTKQLELKALHSQHLRRPALDDGGIEEQHISRVTQEMSRLFNTAHRHLQSIQGYARHGTKTEQKLTLNVVQAVVTRLQDLSLEFRTAQSTYLKSLASREERSNAFFDLPNFEVDLNDLDPQSGLTSNETDFLFKFGPSTSAYNESDAPHNNLKVQKQLLMYQEENTKMIEERETEVNRVVQSIMDLNEIFKDLGNMVHEQGSVLDRIDYNIEQTQIQVHQGLNQLQKAATYQRKNRKLYCIFVLGVTVLVLIMLLVIVKS